MFLRQKKFVPGYVLLLFCLLLAACNTGSQQGGATPRVVTPKVASGSPGLGPAIVVSVTSVPGQASGEAVALPDRVLIINRVSKQQGANQNFTFINLNLAVQNTGPKPIQNLSTFFQLVGPEGDTFGYQYNSSDSFYGPIDPHTTRNGTIMFQLPPAATSGLRLLYRPEIATETIIVLLKVS